MCYRVYLASPLTLTEIRSMLPAGITADLLSPAEQRLFKSAHPAAQTAVLLLHGACSCDLVKPRPAEPEEDERRLRARFRQLKYSREQTIRALENHRRARDQRPGSWTGGLANFVVEHARNAGPSLYYCDFSPDDMVALPREKVETVRAGEVAREPGSWLPEGRLTLITP